LRISIGVLDLPGVVVADRNASTDTVRFGPAAQGLALIDKDLVFATYWTHADPIAQQRHGAIVCAEVPDKVAPRHIIGAYVANKTARDSLAAVVPAGFPITVNASLFFA